MRGDICVNLVGLLGNKATYKRFLSRRNTSAQHLLDLLQDLLDDDSSTQFARPFLIRALLRLSRVSGRHPRCFSILDLKTEGQVDAGNYSDVWKGSVQGEEVCIKIMRLFKTSDIEVLLQEFGREALLWRQLNHPNVLPFFGLYYLEKRLCLISPWMANGNIFEYLRKRRLSVNRLSFVLDVALGVEYLHNNHVVHGDLKSANILVSPSGRACIADFGLSYITNPMTFRFTHLTVERGRGGTLRYQAPELFKDEMNHSGSDIYAFACVCYEIMTGKVPFYEIAKDPAVMAKVLAGTKPSKPSSWSTPLFEQFWQFLQDCWNTVPELRPTATQIVKRLRGSPFQLEMPQGVPDWDEKSTSNARRSLQPQPPTISKAQLEMLIFGRGCYGSCTECDGRAWAWF
ncbi:kinase-like domain-containing protein [Mycena alexandri]|uniref:Kinase-like domain-containing protein n=1 Tax=Mycena alexandri TaxID=1745969 RepID=A0AAD6S3Q0_9AGAR|nr:kinase-like domain-containing protein [Mycena alexandri]